MRKLIFLFAFLPLISFAQETSNPEERYIYVDGSFDQFTLSTIVHAKLTVRKNIFIPAYANNVILRETDDEKLITQLGSNQQCVLNLHQQGYHVNRRISENKDRVLKEVTVSYSQYPAYGYNFLQFTTSTIADQTVSNVYCYGPTGTSIQDLTELFEEYFDVQFYIHNPDYFEEAYLPEELDEFNSIDA